MLIKWKWQVKSNKRRVPETCEWKPWNHSWLQQKDLDASTKDPQTLDPGPGDCSGAWGQTDRQTDNHSDRQTDSCLTFRKPSVRRTLWRPQPPSYGSVDLFLPSLQADWRCRNRSDHNSLTAKRPKCTSSGFWFVCKNIFKTCSLDWVQGAESDKKKKKQAENKVPAWLSPGSGGWHLTKVTEGKEWVMSHCPGTNRSFLWCG